MNTRLDAVIVGGSTAGLSAALYLGRFRRSVVVLDTQQPANRFSHAAHGFFTRDGVAPAELTAIGREQLARYETISLRNAEAITITREDDYFVTALANGSTLHARNILLATGLKDSLPPIDGIESFWGRSVFHCPYCDGWEQRDQPVAIISSGAASLHVATLLRVLTDRVTVCTNGDQSLDRSARDQLDKLNVRLIETPIQRLAGHETQIEHILFADGTELACTAAFVRLTSSPSSDLAAQLGCAMTAEGLVQVDEMGRTTVPGVYAAGDLSSRMRQIIFAASSGAAAGIGINMALVEADFT